MSDEIQEILGWSEIMILSLKWGVVQQTTVLLKIQRHQQSPKKLKAHLHLELCPGHLLRLCSTFSLDCCFSSFGHPQRSEARMTRSQSCWRESVWWCVTPPLLLSHRETLWACRWGRELVGWRFQPSVTPTTNPRRWATAPWPSTLTRWVSVTRV